MGYEHLVMDFGGLSRRPSGTFPAGSSQRVAFATASQMVPGPIWRSWTKSGWHLRRWEMPKTSSTFFFLTPSSSSSSLPIQKKPLGGLTAELIDSFQSTLDLTY